MSELMLRAAAPADVAAITAIYAEAVRHGTATFDLEPPSQAAMGARLAELTAAELPYLVAERAGQILGYAYAAPFRLRAAYASTVEDSVYIARDARGSGVGRRLLEALIVACESLDLRAMLALIGDAGSEASIALHARCGFVHAGVLGAVGYKHGQWRDVVLMQRALGPGASTPPPTPQQRARTGVAGGSGSSRPVRRGKIG